MKYDLINPDLFANDAGEDELPEILNSYFLDKHEFAPFFAPDKRIAFVRSRKGVGKSALLRQALYRRQLENCGDLLFYVKASDLVALQDVDLSSSSSLIYGWQQRICSRINLELGANLRVAVSDDSTTLVERAELNSFRGRNLVGSLLDRLRVKGGGFEISRQRVEQGDSQALLRRVSEKKDVHVWIFIDDIDATFINTDIERLKVSTFFSACRNLASSVNGLNIRGSVRTDVWAILAQHDESLDKCEQYMLDLKWSTGESGRILDNKIRSYFERNHPDRPLAELIPKNGRISSLVFKEPFPWAGRNILAFRPIHIFSGGRPRWATQLCRLGGREAFRNHSDLIQFNHIRNELREYGQSRLGDLYKEHRHQCSAMEDIIESFAGGPALYTTRQLLEKISTDVIDRRGMPRIDGLSVPSGAIAVAHFLYRIGFLGARDDEDPTLPLGFVNFEDRPNLLSTTQNLDDGLSWEVHPSYRAVLRIKMKLR